MYNVCIAVLSYKWLNLSNSNQQKLGLNRVLNI